MTYYKRPIRFWVQDHTEWIYYCKRKDVIYKYPSYGTTWISVSRLPKEAQVITLFEIAFNGVPLFG